MPFTGQHKITLARAARVLTPDFGKSDVIWIVGQSVVGVLGWSTNLEANMHLPVA